MSRCNTCKVEVTGDWAICPLCRNPLKPSVMEEPNPFKDIPLRFQRNLAIKILTFISLIMVTGSFLIVRIRPTRINLPFLVALGTLSMWAVAASIISKRRNIARSIVYQIAILSALAVFWDNYLTWTGWSVDYAIPIICMSALTAMFIANRVVKLRAGDYLLYLLISAVAGMIPLLFLALGWVEYQIPSILSIFLSFIMLAAIVIFRGKEIFLELSKRMHL